MRRYAIVSIISGLLFGLMDGLINANPVAVDLYAVYSPIARSSVNAPAGIVIDLACGFILAGIFLLLYSSLPGPAGIMKGLSFGLIIWFLRVAMGAASQWMVFDIPAAVLLYTLLSGLFEMLVIGILYGLTLKPDPARAL